jgi:hypothetical protein
MEGSYGNGVFGANLPISRWQERGQIEVIFGFQENSEECI